MLSTTSLSSRARFFLEELKTELTFPSLEGRNVKSSIAISNENSERFGNLWKKHGQLIIDAAIATSQSTIWYIKSDGEFAYFDHKPTTELKVYLNENLGSRTRYATLQDKARTLGIESAECKCLQEQDSSLLNLFWENNKRFLLALMNGLPEEERKKIECLTTEVSKRDNTKYFVYYQGNCINRADENKSFKPSNNSETAWLIIKQWAEKNSSTVNLKSLRKNFNPKNCNKYYSNEAYFRHLFYKYEENGLYKADGNKIKDSQIEAGGWDFYSPKCNTDNKFLIETTKDGKIIMLKVWRKDDLKRLIDLVTDPKHKYFNENELSVQPEK